MPAVPRRRSTSTVVKGHEPMAPTPSLEPVETTHTDFTPELVDSTILPAYLALLVLYSALTSFVTGTSLFTMPCFYVSFMLAFYLWHWQAHNRCWWIPFNKGCTTYHKEHHWVEFPPQSFFGSKEALEKYGGQKGADETMSSWTSALPLASSPSHEALIYALFIAILWLSYTPALGICVSLPTLGFAVLMAAGIGTIGNYIHISFHVRGHWLSKYGWWRELQVIHYVHHLGNASHNYAMVNFGLDRLFSTYYKDPATFESAAARKEVASKLPPGLNLGDIQRGLHSSPLAFALLNGAFITDDTRADTRGAAYQRGWGVVFVRALVLAGLLFAFEQLQRGVEWGNSALSSTLMHHAAGASAAQQQQQQQQQQPWMLDRGHAVLQGPHAYLTTHPHLAQQVVAAVSLTIDAAGVLAMGLSVLGKSVRPAIVAAFILAARGVCTLVVTLPTPVGTLWHPPTHFPLPTLLSAFGPRHSYFFSGGIAVVVATSLECAQAAAPLKGWVRVGVGVVGWLAVLGVTLGSLLLRAHWSVDVLAGLLVGRAFVKLASPYARAVDSFLS